MHLYLHSVLGIGIAVAGIGAQPLALRVSVFVQIVQVSGQLASADMLVQKKSICSQGLWLSEKFFFQTVFCLCTGVSDHVEMLIPLQTCLCQYAKRPFQDIRLT